MSPTIQAREDIREAGGVLSYECEKPMKLKSESPGSLEYRSELAEGCFSVIADVNKKRRSTLSRLSTRHLLREMKLP